MNSLVYIITGIIMFFLIVGMTLFLLFTRRGKNITAQIIFNKKYVVCHLTRPASDSEEIHRVVPKSDYMTTVGKYDYDLKPEYALFRWKGRLHYLLEENDAIPKYIKRTDSNQEILMQVQEIKTALHNRSYDFLYAKNKNIALIVACAGMFIAILVAIYAIYKIGQISPMIEWLYAHPPSSTTTIVTGK